MNRDFGNCDQRLVDRTSIRLGKSKYITRYTPLLFLLAVFYSSLILAKTPALTKDEVAAIRQLAEHVDAGARSIFGLMYANGVGITKNDAEAVVWHRRAAEQGDADVQTSVG